MYLPASILGLGNSEIVWVLLVAFLVFGAARLPEIGSSLGKGIKNFKKATRSEEEENETRKKSAPSTPPEIEVK